MMFGGLTKSTLLDYPGQIACVLYTIGCNFHCPYCHNPELVNETVTTRWNEAGIFNFLRSRQGKLDAVVITGGEPTLHADLPAFLTQVKALGFLVKLDSNGTNPAMLEQVITAGLVDYIAMDIKAPLAKYSAVVGRPTITADIRRSIALLLENRVSYEFRTTVVKGLLHPEDFPAIGRDIAGATTYYLQKFVPTKLLNPQFRHKVTYSDDELQHFQQQLSEYVAYCGIR